jgi:nitrile hydratase
MSDPHDHDSHDHHHHHGADPSSSDVLSPELRAEALESLLVESGILSSQAIDRQVERYEQAVGPLNGARVVARAWTDADFKQRLLEDGTAAVAEMGFEGVQMDCLVVKENTPDVHNVVCCSLCSCYPWAVLGLPPAWYKDPAYRSRIVREPRAVLREMGLDLDDPVEVRVWDSSAEIRYLVLPEAPADSADKSVDELIECVSRDSMIGVARL